MTNDVTLKVIDFAEEDEIEEEKDLWTSQINTLMKQRFIIYNIVYKLNIFKSFIFRHLLNPFFNIRNSYCYFINAISVKYIDDLIGKV